MTLNIVEKIDGPVKINHVLASVSDKTGLDHLVRALIEINPKVTIYSTGGTYNAINTWLGPKLAKKNLVQVSKYTGQPEMQGGLVKTLDFKIYLGLLSETYNKAHVLDLKRVKGVPIDMVVVNLYPFKQTISRSGVTPEEARTNIDIGGPCMIRASAKNYLRVSSVTDPVDYDRIADELAQSKGKISLRTRFNLARKAFTHTAEYDSAISRYLAARDFGEIESCYKINQGKKK